MSFRRRRGHAPVGVTPVSEDVRPLGLKQFSMVTIFGSSGFLFHHTKPKAYNGEILFELLMENIIVPMNNPECPPGANISDVYFMRVGVSAAIAVENRPTQAHPIRIFLDNASFHHKAMSKIFDELINPASKHRAKMPADIRIEKGTFLPNFPLKKFQFGCVSFFFLPAYSPMLSPVENTFHMIKSDLAAKSCKTFADCEEVTAQKIRSIDAFVSTSCFKHAMKVCNALKEDNIADLDSLPKELRSWILQSCAYIVYSPRVRAVPFL